VRTCSYEAHTADIRMRVEGDSLDELFRASLEGMSDYIKKGVCNSGIFAENYKISLKTSNVTFLLIDFLSEVLTLSQIHKLIFCKVEFSEISEGELEATLYGRREKNIEEEIKAVTYHEAKVQLNENGLYETTLIFDI